VERPHEHHQQRARRLIVRAGAYPDAGHGGIFQFHDQFTPVAVDFLNR